MVSSLTGNITTIAGNGTAGYAGDGGLATSAELYQPYSVALDSSGNLYIADFGNSVIRKVTAPLASGTITTVAGNGTAGYAGDGGLATSAELNNPRGIALDSTGNLYIADTSNTRVREVNATTLDISTVAGTGTLGYNGDGGLAAKAMLFQPSSVALDSSGNLYIADPGNNRVRKVTNPSNPAMSIITTVVGNGNSGYSGDGGSATSAELYYATAIGVDRSDNIYVFSGRFTGASNPANCGLRKVIKATGYIYTVGGNGACGYSGDGGMATSAEFLAPYSSSVTIDLLGNLYIADANNFRVRVIGASANLTPTITWPAPAAIPYGTALGTTQLDAVAGFSGVPATTCVYTPALGTVLVIGNYTLSVTCTPTGTTVYSPATATVPLTVSRAVLTVTANNASRVYGTANPTFTDTITGFVNGDTAATATTGAAGLTTIATASSGVGNYIITATPGTLAAANYSFTYVNGTLTVTPLGTVSAPTFSPTAGTYSSLQTVTFTDATSGAAIYYTTDGTTPTTSSTAYTGSITVSATETIKAIAVATGYTNSAVASAAYNMN